MDDIQISDKVSKMSQSDHTTNFWDYVIIQVHFSTLLFLFIQLHSMYTKYPLIHLSGELSFFVPRDLKLFLGVPFASLINYLKIPLKRGYGRPFSFCMEFSITVRSSLFFGLGHLSFLIRSSSFFWLWSFSFFGLGRLNIKS